jgi:DNA-binding PucR family transcriptional regulator
VADLLAETAASLLEELDALAEESVREVRDSPGYRERGIDAEDIRDAARRTIGLALHRLAQTPAPAQWLEAPQQMGRRRAEQGVPLNAVHAAYRKDFRILWEALTSRAGLDLQAAALRTWEVLDGIVEGVAAGYRTVELEAQQYLVEQQRQAFSALLASGGHDEHLLRHASSLLGLPVEASYVLVALDSAQQADALTRELRFAQVHHHWQGSATTGFVVAPTGQAGWAPTLAQFAITGRGVLGPVATTLRELPRSARLAELALRAAPSRPGVHAADDHLHAALVVDSPDVAEQIARRVLGPLVTCPQPEHDRLVATLRTYLFGSESMADTARASHQHRNSVLRHLGRVEALTGFDPRNRAHTGLFQIALEWLRLNQPR